LTVWEGGDPAREDHGLGGLTPMRRLQLTLPALCLLAVSCAEEVGPPSAEEVAQVRRELRWRDQIDMAESMRELRRRGPVKVFAAFEVILANPRSDQEVITLFAVLRALEGDSSRLLGPTAERLAHSNAQVRRGALYALAKIGTPEEAPALVALLSDEDYYVATDAASILAKVGGPNEAVALDLWLRGASNRDDAERRGHVRHCLQDLLKRLDAAKK
jgi:hypothetical protein